MSFSKEEQLKIIKILEEKGATRPCSRCGHMNFSLLDGYFNHSIQTSLDGGMVIGGPTVPVITTVCNQCGCLSQHAVGALGLLKNNNGGQ
ncbi:hypothetical protein P9015_26505 [Bacillus cereus]|nr:hypothetical protein [Bacillus cereus]OTY74562.1 hypothetical protein BK753_00030 [Bacillus thuringiensis serovar canadensis]